MSEEKVKPPIQISELVIDRHHKREVGTGKVVPDQTISLVSQAAKETRGYAEQISSSYTSTMADPSKPTAARLLQATKIVTQLHEICARKLDKALEAIDKAEAEIERDFGRVTPVGSTAHDAAVANQIRDRLFAMTSEQRTAALNRAAASGDDVTLAAVLTAPGMLTGISEEMRATYKDLRLQRQHPAEFDRRTRLEKCRQDILRMGHSLNGWVNRLLDDSEAKKLMRKTQEAAAAATSAAEAALREGV